MQISEVWLLKVGRIQGFDAKTGLILIMDDIDDNLSNEKRVPTPRKEISSIQMIQFYKNIIWIEKFFFTNLFLFIFLFNNQYIDNHRHYAF